MNITLKRFEQVNHKGTVSVRCPDCSEHFGLNTRFIDKSSDTLFVYTCPYCGKKHMLKND